VKPLVRVVGDLSVDGVDARDLGSRKGRQLLRRLAVARGSPVPLDALVEELWGADRPTDPVEQVGVLASRLRKVLGRARVVRSDAGLALRDVRLDLDELDERVQEATRALAAGQLGSARAAAEAALALVRGPVLPEEDGAWVLGARSWVDARVADAHHVRAQAAEAAGDLAAAAAAAEAALAHDPYDEVALRALMRAHAGAGRAGSALAAYVRVRQRVAEDLGIDLHPDTEALHDRVVVAEEGGWSSGAAPPPAGGARPRLVGRAAELAALEAQLAAIGPAAPAAVVVVTGEPGVGKSALVSAWRAGLGPRVVALAGRCDELDRDLPLQPLADALADHLRGLGDEEAGRCLGAEAAILGPLLGRPPAAATTDDALTVPDPAVGRAALFGALLAVLERAGDGVPVLLVVEDLHFAGPSTSEWLRFARRRGRNLLVVATSRSDGPTIPGAAHLAVGPLGRAEAEELVAGVDGDRAEAIHRMAGGNPLFLLALAAAAPGELPLTVREAVHRQAASLGGAADTLEAAAVLSGSIDLDLLAGVLDRPATDVLDDLEVAVAAGLLDDGRSGLGFRHELVRAALAEGVGAARRGLLHRSAARVLAARPAPDALAVAVHARLGGDAMLAIDASVEAAAAAMARFDVEAACDLVDSAVALGGSEAAFATRARLRMVQLDLDGAAADADEALARGGSASSFEVAGWIAYYRRRYGDAQRFAEAGARRAGGDAARLVSCQAIAGRVRHGSGDLAGAASWLAAVGGAPPAVQGVADVWRAHCLVHQGAAADALAVLEQPLVDPDHLAHPWAGMHGRFAAAMALGYLGRPAEALARCDDLDAAVARSGAVGARFEGPAANVRAWLLRHLGAGAEADDHNGHALEVTSDPAGLPRSEAVMEYHYVALLDLADGRLLADDGAGAAALAVRLAAVDTWSGTMAWHQRHRLGLLRARLALLDGDAGRACELATAVVADAAGRGARRYEVLGRAWLALAGGLDDREQVATVVDGLASMASLEGWRLAAALADHLGVEAWRAEAGRRAAALVAAAGPRAEQLRVVVGDVLA
jgi:DNA-binding SARP family transcriptional activator